MNVILVTGGRHYAVTGTDRPRDASNDQKARWTSEYGVIHDALHGLGQNVLLINGDCKGVDRTIARLAERWGWFVATVPAPWSSRGRAAGPQRNQVMVDLAAAMQASGNIVTVHAFGGDRGTNDCVDRATRAGLRVIRHDHEKAAL